jgi:hypothetical protein
MSDSLTIWLLQTTEFPHGDPGCPWPAQEINLSEAFDVG